MAYAFGASANVAAFLVAFRLAHLFRRLLGEGALQIAFTPHFEELRQQNPARSLAFFRDLKGTVTAILFLLIALGMAASYGILKSGILSPDNQEIASLFIILLPSLLFICLFGINSGLLQCDGCYFTSGFAPVAFNLVWCGCCLVLSGMVTGTAMVWLSWGIVLACFAQWAVTLPSVKQILHHDLPSWRPRLFSKDVLAVIFPFSLAVVGVAATQVNTALDTLFSRYASLEGPAYLWFAIRIEQAPLSLFGLALSTALFPPLSRAIKQQNKEKAIELFSFAINSMSRLLIPIMVALLALGPHIINLVFGMGGFSREAIVETTYCLWGYAMGLQASAAVILIAPIFYALGNYRLPTLASLSAVVGNVILNAVLVLGIGFGASSIAIATSVSSFINLWMLSQALKKELSTEISVSQQRNTKLLCSFAALLGAAAAWATEFFISGQIAAWSLILGEIPDLPTHFFDKLWILSLPSLAFGAVYLGIIGRQLFTASGLQRIYAKHSQ